MISTLLRKGNKIESSDKKRSFRRIYLRSLRMTYLKGVEKEKAFETYIKRKTQDERNFITITKHKQKFIRQNLFLADMIKGRVTIKSKKERRHVVNES